MNNKLNDIPLSDLIEEITLRLKPMPWIDRRKQIESIIETVSYSFGTDTATIKNSRYRGRFLSYSRSAIWYILRSYTGMELSAIGYATGGYDHTSVLYGINKHRESRINDHFYAAAFMGALWQLIDKEILQFRNVEEAERELSKMDEKSMIKQKPVVKKKRTAKRKKKVATKKKST